MHKARVLGADGTHSGGLRLRTLTVPLPSVPAPSSAVGSCARQHACTGWIARGFRHELRGGVHPPHSQVTFGPGPFQGVGPYLTGLESPDRGPRPLPDRCLRAESDKNAHLPAETASTCLQGPDQRGRGLRSEAPSLISRRRLAPHPGAATARLRRTRSSRFCSTCPSTSRSDSQLRPPQAGTHLQLAEKLDGRTGPGSRTTIMASISTAIASEPISSSADQPDTTDPTRRRP